MPGFTIADPATKVCAGDGFSVALDAHGQVHTCGKGNFGRLGHGDTVSLSAMKKIAWFGRNNVKIKDISAGGRHSLAISRENEETGTQQALYGWGFNYYYQMG